MSQFIDSSKGQSATNLKNMWEQAIQKKKQEAQLNNKPIIKRQETPKVIVNNQLNLEKPVQKMPTQVPQVSNISTRLQNYSQRNTLQMKSNYIQQPKINIQLVKDNSIQSNSSQQSATISVKDRMKLFEKQKNPNIKSHEQQLKMPVEKAIKTPPQTQPFYPPAGPMFVIPNPSSNLPLIQPSSAQSQPILKTPQTQKSPQVQTNQNVIPKQSSMSNKIKMWEEQMKKNSSQNQKPQVQPQVNQFANRMTYQPQTTSKLQDNSLNMKPKQSQINLYDIIGPPSTIKNNNVFLKPVQNQQLQQKSPISSPTKPPVQIHNMSVKQRMQLMKNKLNNTIVQKQRSQPILPSSPLLNEIQISSKPSQQQIINQQIERPMRIKNKPKKGPSFDQI